MDGPVWRRPGRCASSACVEVAFDDDGVQVRDSKLGPKSPVIRYSRSHWEMRCNAMRNVAREGIRYWLPSGCSKTIDGVVWKKNEVTLRFTGKEWEEFEAAVRRGEFDPHPAKSRPATDSEDAVEAAYRRGIRDGRRELEAAVALRGLPADTTLAELVEHELNRVRFAQALDQVGG